MKALGRAPGLAMPSSLTGKENRHIRVTTLVRTLQCEKLKSCFNKNLFIWYSAAKSLSWLRDIKIDGELCQFTGLDFLLFIRNNQHGLLQESRKRFIDQ